MWRFFKQRGGTLEVPPSIPAPSPDRPFPQDFGRYRLLRHLGGGAMGSVYLADDLQLEIRVALKVPHPSLRENPQLRERFFREARAAARLDHPGLCWVLDVGQVGDTPYLVMRYIEGKTLSSFPVMVPRTAATLVRKIAGAMASAHRQGVIHRDLKPDNILISTSGEPVVADFGVARLNTPEALQMTATGALVGTPLYMSPEQLRGIAEAIGPSSDVYSLGVILYQLLTGRVPCKNPIVDLLIEPSKASPTVRPSTHKPGVEAALDEICLKALARDVRQRYADMDAMAADLDAYLAVPQGQGKGQAQIESLAVTETLMTLRGYEAQPASPKGRPEVRREAVRFAFIGHGEQVLASGPPPDRLYLDVGNARRPGVIDHHQVESDYGGSTARLVMSHPELVDASTAPGRDPSAPFTIVLHRLPDLDCVASAFLAIARLTTGAFPLGSEALVRYVDKVDEGALGLSLTNPSSLYAAYQLMSARLAHRRWNDENERWRACVGAGLELVGYVVATAIQRGLSLASVDALDCPGIFTPEDRDEVESDIARYHRKLADPKTGARQVRLELPGQFGGTIGVEALLVRDVQNVDDPERCLFFKDWARSDAARAGNGHGFLALSVFQSEGSLQSRRCILSVTPDSGVTLRGLAGRLDRAEADRRRAIHGQDDRVIDPATGAPRPPRTGYDNADPWYDGRAHGYTIVDAPRGGTRLSADEIEKVLLEFGGTV